MGARVSLQGNWQVGPDGRIRLVTAKPRGPVVRFERLSEDELLRRRVKSFRNFSFQNAKDLIMASHAPERSVAVIESMISPVQAGLLKGWVAGRENEWLRRRVSQLRESCKTSKS